MKLKGLGELKLAFWPERAALKKRFSAKYKHADSYSLPDNFPFDFFLSWNSTNIVDQIHFKLASH